MVDLSVLIPGIPPSWVIQNLPPWMYQRSAYGVAVWQWIALPLAFGISMLAGWLLISALVRILSPIAKRTKTTWDDDLLVAFAAPAQLFAGSLLFSGVEPSFALRRAASDVVGRGIDALIAVSLVWVLFRLLDVVAKRVGAKLSTSTEARDRSGVLSLASISANAAKVLLVFFGFILVLGQLGLNVTGIIAGFGIGGIAVALAGQKTLENLFGSFTLGIDQPLHIGDFIKIDDLSGTVEQVGLRSTRIRTLDRTLVTMPNGRLADMRIENYSSRDRMRLHAKIGLVYSTPPSAVRVIIEEMRAYFRAREDVFQESILVHLIDFGDSAFVIEVMVWKETRKWTDFLGFREEALLDLMEIVERNGSSFAYPTQELRVEMVHEKAMRGPVGSG